MEEKEIEQYLASRSALLDLFDARAAADFFPIFDRRKEYWLLQDDGEGEGRVILAEEKITPSLIEQGQIRSCDLLYHRHLDQYLWKSPEHTMISVDTRLDGIRCLMILRNDPQIEDTGLIRLHEERWGHL